MIQNWHLALFFLIPIAFIAGWWTSGKRNSRNNFKKRKNLHPDYFRGLNYVLNEQPDKAIEVFIKMIEVDSETIETHLALGNLFRRRGEVDRAIRIHQNLIARPNLNDEYRAMAYLELGMDYLKLGILDRAEKLFHDLIDMNMFILQANEYLLEIYQQEKDWEKAIHIARRLESQTSADYRQTIAQFYCEIAAAEQNIDNDRNAIKMIKRALKLDPRCVRASIMEGDLLFNKQDYKGAISAYRRIEKQDPEYTGEVLSKLQQCYEIIGKENEFKKYLSQLINRTSDSNLLRALARVKSYDADDHESFDIMSENLKNNPTIGGINQLLECIIAKPDGDLRDSLAGLKQVAETMLQSRSEYQCKICGFDAKKLHWYCPGCKSWSSIKPLPGM